MPVAPTFATPAAELAELAELAAECLAIERHVGGVGVMQTLARGATHDMLADHARDLGIPAGEIEAAVEAAIKAAANQTTAGAL